LPAKCRGVDEVTALPSLNLPLTKKRHLVLF